MPLSERKAPKCSIEELQEVKFLEQLYSVQLIKIADLEFLRAEQVLTLEKVQIVSLLH